MLLLLSLLTACVEETSPDTDNDTPVVDLDETDGEGSGDTAGGDDTGGDDTDTGDSEDTDTKGTTEVGTPAPEGGWPVSSSCLEGDPVECERLVAETWDRSAEGALVRGDLGSATLSLGGETLTTLEASARLMPQGLTARSDGGWAISGILLSGAVVSGPMYVNGEAQPFTNTYQRFLLFVDDTGALEQVLYFKGFSAEPSVVAARTDGSVVLVGELLGATTLGASSVLAQGGWHGHVLVAAASAEDGWLWATDIPEPEQRGNGRFESASLGPMSETIVSMEVFGTITFGPDASYTCPDQSCTGILGTVNEAGDWIAIGPK